MGLFSKPTSAHAVEVVVLGGEDTLEVVGESFHIENIWRVLGGRPRTTIRCPVTAVLLPEPTNAFDPNAIAVVVDGLLVGHLSREDAVEYGPGLARLHLANPGRHIGLAGVVFGEDRLLGVFLDHDPADFGLSPKRFQRTAPQLRTGLSEAIGSDLRDDSYDLSWVDRLPRDDRGAVAYLRQWLAKDTDPISRHFLFCHLEQSLYRLRALDDSMLTQFDDACRAHDAEMDRIRPCLLDKFGKIPVLECYRQAAIRHQKGRDWQAMLWWAERGLHLYGVEAARPEAVEDLLKRAAAARTKLDASRRPRTATQSKRATSPEAADSGAACRPDRAPMPPPPTAPAGWYQDPAGRYDHRWWDGAQWTRNVGRAGQALIEA